MNLRVPERRRGHRFGERLAGAKRGSRVSQSALKIRYERVRAAEHAPRGPFQLLELRNGFVEIIERGDGVIGERPRVSHNSGSNI